MFLSYCVSTFWTESKPNLQPILSIEVRWLIKSTFSDCKSSTMYHLLCLCLLSAAVGAHAASIPRPDNEDDAGGDRFFGGPPPAYGGPPHSIPFPAGPGGYPANYGGQVNSNFGVNSGEGSNTAYNMQSSQMFSSGSSYTNTGINTPQGNFLTWLIQLVLFKLHF